MHRPEITLRFGAASNDITIDGHTFSRNRLSPRDFAMIRGETIKALGATGGLPAEDVEAWEVARRARQKAARKARKKARKEASQ